MRCFGPGSANARNSESGHSKWVFGAENPVLANGRSGRRGVIGANRTPVFFTRRSGRSHHNLRRSTSNSSCRPAATIGCRVLACLCPPRARSSVCRQIVSGKNSRLSHVRPEMQSWGAPPRSNTENSTGPTPTPGSAFRKGLRQPSAESPALPPGVYRESRRR